MVRATLTTVEEQKTVVSPSPELHQLHEQVADLTPLGLPPGAPTGTPSVAGPKTDPLAPPPESLKEKFANSSTGAKLGGTYLKKSGFWKRKIGEFRGDEAQIVEGRNDELKGKVYQLVGEIREFKEIGIRRFYEKRADLEGVVRDHAGRFLDGAADFVADVKKKLF